MSSLKQKHSWRSLSMLKSVALFVTGVMIGINLDAIVFVYQRVSYVANVLISQF